MNLSTVLMPEDVLLNLSVATKPRLLERLSTHAADRLGLDAAAIEAALLAREGLGSTGIGGRVALPHAVIEGIRAPFAALATLKKPLAFDAVDTQPIEVVFLLLTPPGNAGDHLKILSTVARQLRDMSVLATIRTAASPAEARATLLVNRAS